MIITEHIMDGDYRDDLYRQVLKSDKNGCLLDPALVDEAIAALNNLAQTTDNRKVAGMAGSIVAFFGWNLGLHNTERGKEALLEIASKSLMFCRNSIGETTLGLIVSDLDPMKVRSSGVLN